MDKLLVNSRTSRLQSLQALTELQEYISFRSESGMVPLSLPPPPSFPRLQSCPLSCYLCLGHPKFFMMGSEPVEI